MGMVSRVFDSAHLHLFFLLLPDTSCFSTLRTLSPSQLSNGFFTNVPSTSNHSLNPFFVVTFATFVMSDFLYARNTTLYVGSYFFTVVVISTCYVSACLQMFIPKYHPSCPHRWYRIRCMWSKYTARR